MNEPLWVRTYRLAFAVLAIVAVIRKYFLDDDPLGNYLSAFTTQSNVIAAAVLLGGALLGADVLASLRWDRIRGAAVTYLVTTFFVYGFLLGGFTNPFTTTRNWTHTVVHQIIPAVMLLDLLIRPFVHRLKWRDAFSWTVYPILFLAYSLIRGAIIDWYPYDFINPREVGGYDGVALYSLGIAAGFLCFAFLVVWIGRWRGEPSMAEPTSQPAPGSAQL